MKSKIPNVEKSLVILNLIFVFMLLSAVAAPQCYAAAREDPLSAAMYNEMGVKALDDGQVEVAISYFEQARKFDPSNTTVKKNLSVAYLRQADIEYTQKNTSYAKECLKAALENDPENINALYLMGEIKYLSQDLDGAKALWQKMLKLAPDFQYAGVIKEKLGKLDKEAKVEKEYRAASAEPFEIRYAKEGATLSYDVRYYLREAYRILGQEFNLRPKYKITVIIYDKKEFEGMGTWGKGVVGGYDGKLRLPFINADFSPDEIRGIIWHEYTHLLVHDISDDNAPSWLNEGLAQYEGYKYLKKDFSLLKRAVDNNKLIAFKDLEMLLKVFVNNTEQYSLACQEACSIATYMMKKYNRYKIREILQLFGEGWTFEDIAKNKLNVTVKEFEKRWLAELHAGKLY